MPHFSKCVLGYSPTSFADAGNTYYIKHLLAAKGLGTANGIGSNLFAPKQEMLVILYNALKVIGKPPAQTLGKQLSDFSDANQTASWAQEAFGTLIRSGSNGKIAPA